MIGRIIVGVFGSEWRLKSLCQRAGNPVLKRALIGLYKLHQYENNSSIAWNSTFDGVPCLPHGAKSIFISGGAQIGANCVIFQQVTIGSNTLPGSKGTGCPTIGRNCYISAGAKIVGRVRVGNNVRIGANAVVYKDVPDNTVVLSGEQRMITKESPLDNRFYSYRDGWYFFEDSHWIPVRDEIVLAKLDDGTVNAD
jgi:serine O-acetyltransferase